METNIYIEMHRTMWNKVIKRLIDRKGEFRVIGVSLQGIIGRINHDTPRILLTQNQAAAVGACIPTTGE